MKLDTPTTVYVVLDVILALVVIGGNVLVCYVILNSTNLRKKAMYIFVTSLAFADICVGITAIPFGILTKLGYPYNSPTLCITMLSFIVISTQISIFNMMTIAVERYLAIRHPRIHYTKLTPTRALYVIALTWIIASLVGCLPLLGWNKMEDFSFEVNHTAEVFPNHIISREDTSDGISAASNLTSSNVTNMMLIDNNFIQPHTHCKFMKMMDENYMFFNFTACVLPPLVICAVLYFIIFLSLIKSKPLSQGLYEQHKYSCVNYNTRTPVLLPRKNGNTSPRLQMGAHNSKSHPKKAKLVFDLCHGSLLSCEVPQTKNYQENFHNREKLVLPTTLSKASTDNSNHPLLTSGASKVENSTGQAHSEIIKGVDDESICDRLKNLALDEFHPHPNYCQAYRLKFGHALLSDNAVSAKSSCASTPVMVRSFSGTKLNWDEGKKERHHSHSRSKREIHAATVLGLIVLSFVICWMPIHILNTISRFDVDKTIDIPAWLFDVGVLLSHTNSAVNFFLYSWRLKAFRKQLHLVTLRKISRS